MCYHYKNSTKHVSLVQIIIISLKINLFSPWYIAEKLNNNHSLQFNLQWLNCTILWNIFFSKLLIYNLCISLYHNFCFINISIYEKYSDYSNKKIGLWVIYIWSSTPLKLLPTLLACMWVFLMNKRVVLYPFPTVSIISYTNCVNHELIKRKIKTKIPHCRNSSKIQ